MARIGKGKENDGNRAGIPSDWKRRKKVNRRNKDSHEVVKRRKKVTRHVAKFCCSPKTEEISENGEQQKN